MDMPASHPPIDIKLDYITFKIDIFNERAKTIASEVYEEKVGLSLRELRLMRFIAAQPGLTVTRLVEQTHIEKTLTSKSLATLVKRKLVRRAIDPGDARQTNLYLTADGIARVRAADQLGRHMEDHMMSVLSPAETKTFKLCLEKLYALHENARKAADTYLEPQDATLPRVTLFTDTEPT